MRNVWNHDGRVPEEPLRQVQQEAWMSVSSGAVWRHRTGCYRYDRPEEELRRWLRAGEQGREMCEENQDPSLPQVQSRQRLLRRGRAELQNRAR